MDSLWVCTPFGLNLLIKKGDSVSVANAWTGRKGLYYNDLYDIEISGDTLLLASAKGITIYPGFFSKKQKSQSEKPIYLKELKLGELEMGPAKKFSFSADHEPILLVFRDLNFSQLGNLEYRYRLSFDKSWQMAQGHSIQLNSLSSGDYRVEIQSRIPGGQWSKPYLLAELEIKPKWSQTLLWFALFALILILAFTFLYGRKLLIPKWKQRIWQRETALSTEIGLTYRLLSETNHNIANMLTKGDMDGPLKLMAKYQKLAKLMVQKTELEWIDGREEMYLTKNFLEMQQMAQPYLKIEMRGMEEIDIQNVMIPKFAFLHATEALFRLFPLGKKNLAFLFQSIKIGKTYQFLIQLSEVGKESGYEKNNLEFEGSVAELKQNLEELGSKRKTRIEMLVQKVEESNSNGMGIQIWIPEGIA